MVVNPTFLAAPTRSCQSSPMYYQVDLTDELNSAQLVSR